MVSAPDHTFERKRMWLALMPSLVWVILVWLAFAINASGVLKGFSRWGIMPREWEGLKGVVFSPFLHSSLSHVWSNTLPLLILTWFLFYFYSKIAFRAFIYLWITSGLITWAIGRGAYHVGASGLVFGLLFFLFFSGLVRRYIPLVAVSLVVAFIYGSTVWSILPITEWVDATISWEGHLAGAISGLVFALVFRNEGPQKPQPVWDEEDEEGEEEDGDEDVAFFS